MSLLEQWHDCQLLSFFEQEIVLYMLLAARNGYTEFEETVTFMSNNYGVELITAINKARHVGIGKYAKDP